MTLSKIDKLADAAAPAMGRLAGAYDDATGALPDVADQASEAKDQWIADLRDFVRDRPIAAVAAALAVGALYVKLTSSSRRAPRARDDD